jgi:hypothetical protein
MSLSLTLGDRDDLTWAQRIVTQYHYLRRPVDPRARPMTYVLRHADHTVQRPLGLVMLGIPHATKCRGWWGYPGLPTQWQVVDLCRIWLDPDVQAGGRFCNPHTVPGFHDRRGRFQPTTATWMIAETLRRVQADRVSLWPPVQLSQPYHIRLAISYHDPKYHRGTIYRQSNATPMYTDATGPIPGSSGKFGWCWRLSEPTWSWEWLDYRPRQIQFEMNEEVTP